MPQQPPMHRRRLVGREVVQHDVDLPLGLDARVDVAEERDEVLGAMLRLAPRDHLAGRDVQRGEEIDRAMPQVVVGPSFGLPDVHRQDRLRALERLDLGFLVDREHDRIVRRVHIQPDDIPHLGHQLRIGRQLERLGDVRLQAERAPDAADHRVTHARRLGHRAGAPVRLALRRRLQRFDNHRLDRVVGHDPRRADPRLVVQPRQSAGDEPEPPFGHGGLRRAQAARHGLSGRRRRTRAPRARETRRPD